MAELKLEVKKLEDRDTKQSCEQCLSGVDCEGLMGWLLECPMCQAPPA
ncbi:MAG: hypothetical protein SVM80_05265 [Halobacteriota archaeon]|nr:hypothetical protein [Halobacteriota archaeon]